MASRARARAAAAVEQEAKSSNRARKGRVADQKLK